MENLIKYQTTRKIIKDILIAYNDYQYFSLPTSDIVKAAVIDQNQALFARLKYFLFYFMVVELNKIFNGNEDYNIRKFLNINQDSDYVVISSDNLEKIINLKRSFKQKEYSQAIKKIENLRNQFYAHLDETRKYDETSDLNIHEIELVLKKLIECISVLNYIFEGHDFELGVNEELLQHKLYSYIYKNMIRK